MLENYTELLLVIVSAVTGSHSFTRKGLRKPASHQPTLASLLSKILRPMANLASSTDATVNFIVGGVYYSLLLSDIQAHKDSYFASVIKDEWNCSDEPIVIDRDGVLFQHIFVYIYNRRYEMPFAVKGSLALLVSVRREADYYNLPELVAACDQTYKRELTQWCKTQPLQELCDAYTLQTDEGTELDALISSEVYPGCHTGVLNDERLFSSVSIAEAVAEAPVCNNDANKYNICHLYLTDENRYLESLQKLLPYLPGVRCCLDNDLGGIFAVKKDGYQHATHLGVKSANRIGTVVYIVDSDYTGGVITVTKNGVSKSITQPGEFILYTSDYTRTISTVTSGALVFAKLDIVQEILLDEDSFYCEVVSPKLVPYPSLPSNVGDLLMQAVYSELKSDSNRTSVDGLVLCLSTLYPIVEFDPSGPYLETDPDSLKDRDAVIYGNLKNAFTVSLVTVYVHRGADSTAGCVLGPVPSTSDKECTAKVKIIAPFHGFRESFEMYSYEKKSSKVCYATLYTALYIALK